jgi:lysophospholipase L1-like esterase
MPDGQHEGVPGARIDEIYSYMDKSLDSKPNVYLINAGTNDCQQNHLKMNGTIRRMNDLLTKARAVSTKATIILSTLTPSFNGAGANQRVNLLNIEIRERKSYLDPTCVGQTWANTSFVVAAKLRKDGISIVLAEMNDGFLSKPDFNADGIHPTNDGYKKMAAVWTAAILEAREAGMLQDPEDNGQDDDVPMIN